MKILSVCGCFFPQQQIAWGTPWQDQPRAVRPREAGGEVWRGPAQRPELGTSDFGAVGTFCPWSLCPRQVGLNQRDEEDDDMETVLRVTLDAELTLHFTNERTEAHTEPRCDLGLRGPATPLGFVPNLANSAWEAKDQMLRGF